MAKSFKITQLNRQMAIVDKDGAVHFPTGVTEIGAGAFRGMKNIRSVVIPDGVTEIGKEAFAECINLVSVTLPEGLTVLPERVFAECTSIVEVKLPSTLVCLESEAFADCISLPAIDLPDSVKSLGSTWGPGPFTGCASLVSVNLSAKIESIVQKAFFNCESLVEIYIPESVKSIQYSAFAGCKNLIGVTGAAGLTAVKENAFDDCPKFDARTLRPSICYRYTDTKKDGAVTVDDEGCFALSSCTKEELEELRSFSTGYLWQEKGSFTFDRCGSDYEFCYDEDDRGSSGSFDKIYDLSNEHCLVKNGKVIGFYFHGVSLLLQKPKKHVHKDDSYNGVTDISDTTYCLIKKNKKR